MFRTYGWDLGIYNNAIWDYSHFRVNVCNIEYWKVKNLLADHFEIYPIIFSPLRFIFGTYALLVVQIASVLFGGYGVYSYLLLKTENENLSTIGMLHFFLSWGIYAALSFDYHNNVVAAMLVPWFLLYFEKQKVGMAGLFFVLILIGKENMALWAVFIAMALALSNLKNKPKRNYAFLLSIAALIYFISMLEWIMPALGSLNHKYSHFLYNTLGTDMGSALHTIFTRPFYTFKLLFVNTTGLSENNWIKARTHLMVLAIGGWALFFRPKYLLMLVPIYCQKLFNDEPEKWGMGVHYSIEFIPIISIALFEVINSLLKERKALITGVACAIITGSLSYIYIKDNKDAVRSNIFNGGHYKNDYNIPKANQAMSLIPANAPLSAQTEFCPHVAFRDTVFLYPRTVGASYILLSRSNAAYPLSMAENQKDIEDCLASGSWQKIYDEGNVLILKRIK